MHRMDRMDAVDWLGNFLSCRDCPHVEIREKGLCDLGQVCVRDRRARRIDRFFAASPQESAKYLDHPYFELRVGAVKYASVFQLRALIDDEEPDVRAMVAQRLPLRLAEKLIGDSDRKVRMAMAQRVEGAGLVKLLFDEDSGVRLIAARRPISSPARRMMTTRRCDAKRRDGSPSTSFRP